MQFFDANSTNNGDRTKANHDDAVSAATRLDIGLAATVVAAGVGLGLILTAPDSPAPVGMGVTPAGATIHVSF